MDENLLLNQFPNFLYAVILLLSLLFYWEENISLTIVWRLFCFCPIKEYRNSKRFSRDIETLTDEEICATIEGNGQIRLTLRKESKSVATDNIEEVQEDNPFAGQFKYIFFFPKSLLKKRVNQIYP